MSNEKAKLITQEKNLPDKGLLISSIIIFAGLLPEITIGIIKISFFDSWSLILIGISMFFYFASLKVNQYDEVDKEGIVWTKTPVHYKCKLSEELFYISIISLSLFFFRGFYILIKLILQS
ncbi:MAG: hypothetical protein PHH83_05000 [Patescibacteria group bacterium]|nr:hypothetical protein [Patescibacteria group bacterium]